MSLTASQQIREETGLDFETAGDDEFEKHIHALEMVIDSDSSILVTGNPVDGIQLRGPFVNAEEAGQWAEHHMGAVEWWVARCEQVER